MENFGKLPQISGLRPTVKFCTDRQKTDLQTFGRPLNRTIMHETRAISLLHFIEPIFIVQIFLT